MRLLAIPGALRTASLNRRLLTAALKLETAVPPAASVELIDLRDFPLPPYDGDIESGEGIPEACQRLSDLIGGVDGLLVASPEYNHSIAGTFKNVIDWLSRVRPVTLKGKSAFLMSASPGLVGGNRGLWALRVPLEQLGVYVHPAMFSLGGAETAFNEDGSLADQGNEKRLSGMLAEFKARLAKQLA